MVEGKRSGLSSRLKLLANPAAFKAASHPKNHMKKNLRDFHITDLLATAKSLKKNGISTLHLFQRREEALARKCRSGNQKLSFLSLKCTSHLFTFSRALAWALCGGGYLQDLEIGFCLWERDLQILAEALCKSSTLKRLSFANSELGDRNLQILGRGLRECAQLEILNLSFCSLTDAVAPLLCSILKASVCRNAEADWQASLRKEGSSGLTTQASGLRALDMSFNIFSDSTIRSLYSVLRTCPALEALNLRSNRLSRVSGKLMLEVMQEWVILRYVDLRDNVDNNLMAVLEEGHHLFNFTAPPTFPFWVTEPNPNWAKPKWKKKPARKAISQHSNDGPPHQLNHTKPKEPTKESIVSSCHRPYTAPHLKLRRNQSKTHNKVEECIPKSSIAAINKGMEPIFSQVSMDPSAHMVFERSPSAGTSPEIAGGSDCFNNGYNQGSNGDESFSEMAARQSYEASLAYQSKHEEAAASDMSFCPDSQSFTRQREGKESMELATAVKRLYQRDDFVFSGLAIEKETIFMASASGQPKQTLNLSQTLDPNQTRNHSQTLNHFQNLDHFQTLNCSQISNHSQTQNWPRTLNRSRKQPTASGIAGEKTRADSKRAPVMGRRFSRPVAQKSRIKARSDYMERLKFSYQVGNVTRKPNPEKRNFCKARNMTAKTRNTEKILNPDSDSPNDPDWNSFIKDITEALLHLQDRLDKLIGPPEPNSIYPKVQL